MTLRLTWIFIFLKKEAAFNFKFLIRFTFRTQIFFSALLGPKKWPGGLPVRLNATHSILEPRKRNLEITPWPLVGLTTDLGRAGPSFGLFLVYGRFRFRLVDNENQVTRKEKVQAPNGLTKKKEEKRRRKRKRTSTAVALIPWPQF